jgi:hypothetical protein
LSGSRTRSHPTFTEKIPKGCQYSENLQILSIPESRRGCQKVPAVHIVETLDFLPGRAPGEINIFEKGGEIMKIKIHVKAGFPDNPGDLRQSVRACLSGSNSDPEGLEQHTVYQLRPAPSCAIGKNVNRIGPATGN